MLPVEPRYHYKPLGQGQLRILKLFPGEFDDPLWGRLDHCRFDPPHTLPTYEALSYAWGNQDNPETLTLVGNSLVSLANLTLRPDTTDITREHSLHIGQNLASALRDLRSTSETRIIWCDAVCINQQDLPERAVQVERMEDIFRHADRVVVWLAPDNDHLSHAMRMLDDIGCHIELDAKNNPGMIEGMDDIMRDDYLVPFSIYDWQCVVDLISLPWFSRVWVRQEISLANNSATIASGRHQLLWSKFSSAMYYLEVKLKWDEIAVKADQRPSMTTVARNVWNLFDSKSYPHNSWAIIKKMDGCQCTDPRDRIYSIIGLQHDLDIHIDYGKPVKEVYADWALGYYKYHSSLAFLSRCEMASSPSWVPDLDNPLSLWLHVNSASAGRCKGYFDLLPDKSSKLLATRCGIVSQHTSTMPQEPNSEVIQDTLESWVRQLFPGGFQSCDSLAMNDLATAVTGGRAVEHRSKWGKFSMLDVQRVLLQNSAEPTLSGHRRSPILPTLVAEFKNLLPNAAVFATNEGHFGLGSGAACEGDEIFVVLGCRFPILMRLVADSKYIIVGPCYIPHLSHGEAILGPLPDGWKMVFNESSSMIFCTPDGKRIREDPRVKRDLPPGWEQYEDEQGLWWKRYEDEDWRLFDSRQTPEKLEARGVKLEMVTIV